MHGHGGRASGLGAVAAVSIDVCVRAAPRQLQPEVVSRTGSRCGHAGDRSGRPLSASPPSRHESPRSGPGFSDGPPSRAMAAMPASADGDTAGAVDGWRLGAGFGDRDGRHGASDRRRRITARIRATASCTGRISMPMCDRLSCGRKRCQRRIRRSARCGEASGDRPSSRLATTTAIDAWARATACATCARTRAASNTAGSAPAECAATIGAPDPRQGLRSRPDAAAPMQPLSSAHRPSQMLASHVTIHSQGRILRARIDRWTKYQPRNSPVRASDRVQSSTHPFDPPHTRCHLLSLNSLLTLTWAPDMTTSRKKTFWAPLGPPDSEPALRQTRSHSGRF